MNRFNGIRRVLRLGARPAELNEELAFHFDLTVEELVAQGLTPRQAEEEARRRFGDERRWRRELGRIDRSASLREGGMDRLGAAADVLRYAFRRIGRSPGLALGVILTFGLGIGANATMFAIVDRLLLSPPAHVQDAASVRRAVVRADDSAEITHSSVFSYPQLQDLSAATSFSVAAYAGRSLTVGRGEEAREISAALATGNFFSLLGARPQLGRFYTPEEDRVGAEGVAVIGQEMWRRDFAGDPDVIGSTVDFGYGPFTIVGVAPPGFTGADLGRVDLWVPLRTGQALMAGTWWQNGRHGFWLHPVMRLAAGVDPTVAEAEATALVRQGDASAGIDSERLRVVATPLLAARGPDAPPEAAVARWLAGLSLLVLLIACANVANLLLAHTIRQRREVGIRLALGSSRTRIAAQVLTESLLLATLGGGAALLFARVAGGLLGTTLLPDVEWQSTGLEWRVATLVLLLSCTAGIAAGVIPGLQAARPRVSETLKSGGRSVTTAGGRPRSALTVLQAALSVVLLIGSGLFVRSLQEVRSLDLGFEPEGVLLVNPVFERGLTPPERVQILIRAREELLRLPGVTHASGDITVPFQSIQGVGLRVPGVDSIPGSTAIHTVDPGYFAGMGLRVLRGRPLTADDGLGTPRVVVVNEAMATRLWPGEEALGRCLLVNADEENADELPCSTVVGIVEDAVDFDLVEERRMHYFVPAAQQQVQSEPEAMLIRVEGDAEEMIGPVQRALFRVDPRLRYARVGPLQDRIDPRARSWRLGATMFTAFGLLALLVAGIGLYSVLAFGVAERTQELGIRAALGAGRGQLVGMVVRKGMQLVGIGVALGLLAAMIAASRIEPLLFQVRPRDPLVFAAAAGAFLLVGLLASVVPARRATRVDPMVALRAD
jgi:putative ABC transport system permease protein